MKYNIRTTNYIYLNELLKNNQEANKNSLDKLYKISFCDKNFLISLNLLNILEKLTLTTKLDGKRFINQTDIDREPFNIIIENELINHGYLPLYIGTPEQLFHQSELKNSQETVLAYCQTEMNSIY
ncbi:hypothetical protein L3V83_09025 [Thiotrichales bacterium 19X7-9]|nr:hypothetical protein [Thiotrichales bacterium 19X7-9]